MSKLRWFALGAALASAWVGASSIAAEICDASYPDACIPRYRNSATSIVMTLASEDLPSSHQTRTSLTRTATDLVVTRGNAARTARSALDRPSNG